MDPLLKASRAGYYEIYEERMRMLVDAGADIEGERALQAFQVATNPKDYSFNQMQDEAVAKLLLYSGVDVQGTSQPLICAILAGSERLGKLLLWTEVDIHGHGSFCYFAEDRYS